MGSDAKDHTAEREAQCHRSPTPVPGARSPEAGARSPEGRCHLNRRRHRGLLHRAGRSRWSCDSAHRQGNSGCGCDLDNCVGHVLTLDRRNLVAPRPVPSRHLRCRHRSADGWVSERCAVRLVTSCCQAIPTQDARDAPRFNPDPIPILRCVANYRHAARLPDHPSGVRPAPGPVANAPAWQLRPRTSTEAVPFHSAGKRLPLVYWRSPQPARESRFPRPSRHSHAFPDGLIVLTCDDDAECGAADSPRQQRRRRPHRH